MHKFLSSSEVHTKRFRLAAYCQYTKQPTSTTLLHLLRNSLKYEQQCSLGLHKQYVTNEYSEQLQFLRFSYLFKLRFPGIHKTLPLHTITIHCSTLIC